MLVHVVAFTFKESTSAAEIEEFHSVMSSFTARVPYLRAAQNGVDIGERPNNAGYGLVAQFDNSADFNAYLSHPLHVELAQSAIAPICESWSSTQFLVN